MPRTKTITNTEFLSPVILDARYPDMSDPAKDLNESNIEIFHKFHPRLVRMFERNKFVQRGENSYAIGLSEENHDHLDQFFRDYASKFNPYMIVSDALFENDSYYDDSTRIFGWNLYPDRINDDFYSQDRTNIQSNVRPYLARKSKKYTMPNVIIEKGGIHHTDPLTWQAQTAAVLVVRLASDGNSLWFSLRKLNKVNYMTEEAYNVTGRANPILLNRRNNAHLMLSASQIASLDVLTHSTYEKMWVPETREALMDMAEQVKESILVSYENANLTAIKVSIGSGFYHTTTGAIKKRCAELMKPFADISWFKSYTANTCSIGAGDLNKMVKAFEKDGTKVLVHPGLIDIMNMGNAKPYKRDKRLRDYQQEAVGLHLSTELGYLQASSTGMGKTVIQLKSMALRAAKADIYRALIVAEVNVRVQWKEEAEKWFPAAKVVAVETARDISDLKKALVSLDPVVVVTSYALAAKAQDTFEAREEERNNFMLLDDEERMAFMSAQQSATLGAILLDTHWNDICADEAMVIRNGGSSKQNRALWNIRANSGVAVALTATPINKSADDLGNLIAWVRNDRGLFRGASKLSNLYDTTNAQSAKRLYDNLTPLIFRADTSRLADELPNVTQEVVCLEGNAAEQSLFRAAEKELKRLYEELVAALDEIEANQSASADEIAEAKENLKKARGAWIGGTQLARMATSDPSVLLDSESVGAALLNGQGLVDAALEGTPSKRARMIEIALNAQANDEQVLVFTDFSSVADNLADILENEGIRAVAYTGKTSAKTRDVYRRDFQEGKIDVMICTKAAERGITLHKASHIVHFDLPWTVERILQRVGRSVRFGTKNTQVEVTFLIMEDSVEHRIAEQLVTLGVSSSLVLDNSRGVDVKTTETAGALSGLISTVGTKMDNQNIRDFGANILGIAA